MIRKYTEAIQEVCNEFVSTRSLNPHNLIFLLDDVLEDIYYKSTLRRRLFGNRFSLHYYFLKNGIHHVDTSIRKRVLTLYTNYLYKDLSNIELNSNTSKVLK